MRRSKLLGAMSTIGVVSAFAAVALASSPSPSDQVLTGSGTSKASQSSAKGGSTNPATGCNANGQCNGLPKDFGVEVAAVSGLFPGSIKPITVTFRNPNAFPIYVTSARVATVTLRASGTSQPACNADDLVKGSHVFQGAGLRVPAKESVTTDLVTLTLRHAAPNACQGASWSFNVTAQAVK